MRILQLFSFLILLPLVACVDTTSESPDAGGPSSPEASRPQEPEQPTVEDECTSDTDCSNGQRCSSGQCLTPSSSNDTFLCSREDPCPNGQFCFNGLCAIGCLSDGDCADDQYCDTEGNQRCVNKVVETCPESPCESNQTCVDGYCVATSIPTTCTPSADGDDGCDAYSICLDHSDDDTPDYRCTSFPACPEDGVCPTGPYGAVCNSGHIPNKGRICLVGLCDDDDHCPSAAACLEVGAQLGICSDGSFGSLCTAQQDVCEDGLECTTTLPGQPGFCFGEPVGPSPEPSPGVEPEDLCDENTPCANNSFCLNGLCAIGCQADADCSETQYCDVEGTGLCATAVIAICPEAPCEANQQCRDGFCVQVQTQTCTPTFDGNDGCDANSLCLDQAEAGASEADYRCTTMPPCPADGVCPTENIGAVCNDGYLEGKNRFCLTALCANQGNCAEEFTCVDFDGPLGACSNGSLGTICTEEQDVCQPGMSCEVLFGGPGFCTPGGAGGGSCSELGGACTDFFSCDGMPIVEATDCGFSEICCPL